MANTGDMFNEIHDKYSRLVMKVVHDITQDYQASEDICQKTFFKMDTYLKNPDKDRIKRWLIVAAINEAKDYLRKAHVRIETPLMDSRVIWRGNADEYINRYLDSLAVYEFNTRMLSALRRKNMDWYTTLVMVEYLEIPRREAARYCGVSLSSVDKRLRRAKKWLQEKFGEEYKGL